MPLWVLQPDPCSGTLWGNPCSIPVNTAGGLSSSSMAAVAWGQSDPPGMTKPLSWPVQCSARKAVTNLAMTGRDGGCHSVHPLLAENGAGVRFCTLDLALGPWPSCLQQPVLYFGWSDGARGTDLGAPPRPLARQAEATQVSPCPSKSAHMPLLQGSGPCSSLSCLEGSSHPPPCCPVVRDGFPGGHQPGSLVTC